MDSYTFDVVNRIKDSVSMYDVCRAEGIKTTKSNFAICPFHADKHASMKIYPKRYHCFACGADGDVIDFYSKQYNLDFSNALQAIISRLQLPITLDVSLPPEEQKRLQEAHRRATEEKARIEAAEQAKEAQCHTLLDLWIMYDRWIADYPPQPFEDIDPRYIEAVQNIDNIEYRLSLAEMG